jgi:hypothetical protein
VRDAPGTYIAKLAPLRHRVIVKLHDQHLPEDAHARAELRADVQSALQSHVAGGEQVRFSTESRVSLLQYIRFNGSPCTATQIEF